MYFPVQGNPCLFFEHTVFNENSHKRKQLYGLLKSGGHVDTDAVQISPLCTRTRNFQMTSETKVVKIRFINLSEKLFFKLMFVPGKILTEKYSDQLSVLPRLLITPPLHPRAPKIFQSSP